jgi:RHS repeat-associated protein
LGSPRVITDKNGNVISRRDFLPFGDEIGVDTIQTSNRSNNPQYATADKVRQKYTGYQKDEETKLDFAEARMYQNKHGRFTAVDPLMASGRPINPQTFNRYVYTGNNPINYTDPSGLDYCRDGNNVVTYSASGNCGSGTNVTGTYGTVSQVGPVQGSSGNERVGSVVFFHKNRIEVIRNPTQEQRNLAKQQTGLKTAEVTISGGSAAEICTTESQQPSSIFTPAPLTPLPLGNSNGSGQSHNNNGANSISAGEADNTGPIGLALEYFTGTGQKDRQFGPDSEMTKEMRTSPMLDYHRNIFINQGGGSYDSQIYANVHDKYPPRYGFPDASDGPWTSGINLSRQFVGSFNVKITELKDSNGNFNGDALFEARNPTHFNSFLYGSGFEKIGINIPSWNRSKDLTVYRIMGRTDQTFWWIEKGVIKR